MEHNENVTQDNKSLSSDLNPEPSEPEVVIPTGSRRSVIDHVTENKNTVKVCSRNDVCYFPYIIHSDIHLSQTQYDCHTIWVQSEFIFFSVSLFTVPNKKLQVRDVDLHEVYILFTYRGFREN